MREPTIPGFASPGPFRLQGSSALLTVCFSHALHGLVSCRARVGFTLRSFSLRGEGACLSTRPCPRVVGSNGARLPRAPRPTAGPSSLRKSVARTAEWSRRASRGSLGLVPLQGFLPGPDDPRLPAGLLSRTSRGRHIPRRSLRVSIVTGPVRLRGDHRPSWGSCTSFRFPSIRIGATRAHGFASNVG